MISYLSDEKDSKRQTIWKLARTIYGEAVPSPMKTIPELKDFKWDECDGWILKSIIENTASRVNLDVSKILISVLKMRLAIWMK